MVATERIAAAAHIDPSYSKEGTNVTPMSPWASARQSDPPNILIIISIPSPPHSFISGLKPSFSAKPFHRSLFSSGLTLRIAWTIYRYF